MGIDAEGGLADGSIPPLLCSICGHEAMVHYSHDACEPCTLAGDGPCAAWRCDMCGGIDCSQSFEST